MPLQFTLGVIVAKEIPGTEKYVKTLNADIEAQKEAVLSGNKAEMAKTAEKGAKDTKAGAQAVKSNPKLFKLADIIAPEKLKEFAAGIRKGTKNPKDENDLMGALNRQVLDNIVRKCSDPCSKIENL